MSFRAPPFSRVETPRGAGNVLALVPVGRKNIRVEIDRWLVHVLTPRQGQSHVIIALELPVSAGAGPDAICGCVQCTKHQRHWRASSRRRRKLPRVGPDEAVA